MSLNEKNIQETMFHTLSAAQSLEVLQSGPEGITEEEVSNRIAVYGKNELQEGKKKSLVEMFIEQFKNVMVIILIIAAGISGFLGEVTDTVIILIVVMINAILGILQESKAEKALAALKRMSSPYAKVKRNGETKVIKTEEIVPGDIVFLEAGDYVPADLRLLESASLKIEEAALTGESVPAEKFVKEIEQADTVIGDRKNMAYLGSSVTYGRGFGVVSSTGMNTEVGKIAGLISSQDTEETPLQQKLSEMGKYLTIGVVVIAGIIFAAGVLQGRSYLEMFLTSVSLAVAAIPEGLPAIVTIVLAMGVQKMAKRNAIIRKLPAVETLGSTEIICSDKTGTLTQNKMTVKELYLGNRLIDSEENVELTEEFTTFMNIMILCNDSKVSNSESASREVIGDPTETALVHFGFNKGYEKNKMDKKTPRIAEIPFDSERKLMTTVNQDIDGKLRIMTKGAPDILLKRCCSVLRDGQIIPITQAVIDDIKSANSLMAAKALRILAMAYRDIEAAPQDMSSDNIENNLVFSGLVGMIDPPRIEVKEAVQICRGAGIRPVMITGDHKDTAAAIAKELEIIHNDNEVITGSELDKINDEDFLKKVSDYSVYARVSPEHKVRIVKAWKDNGKIVAMTGDGVNDAPALKTSDIGIGMGITGTDVAKGVSDMVLSDDNFATIVVAVEEGRKIYSNIRKSIQFLLSANMGEVLTLFVATMLNWSILLPIHILWINLVTDTFPALALGVEEAEKDIMNDKPRNAKGSVFSNGVGINVIYQGIIEGVITLSAFYVSMRLYSESVATTIAFATLGLIQLTHSFNVRSNTKSIFRISMFSNMYLIGADLISGLLLIMVIIIPGLNNVFKVQHLSFQHWALVICSSLLIIPVIEVVKIIRNKNVNK